MRKRVIFLFTGIVAVLFIIALILFFDPFRELFDGIFVKKNDYGEESDNYRRLWQGWQIAAQQADSEAGDEFQRMQGILNRYFDCFYSPNREDTAAEEIEDFFQDGCVDCIYDEAALYSLLLRKENSPLGYNPESTDLHLWVKNIVPINKNGYIITLTQSAEMRYSSYAEFFCGEGIYTHTFIFQRQQGKWMLTYHECDGGAWKYARQELRAICGTQTPDFDIAYNGYLRLCDRLPSDYGAVRELLLTEGYPAPYKPSTAYNRTAAAEYALRWTSAITRSRNVTRWKDYENDGGNFTSQCIFEGIGKMDTKGDFIWKWFDDKTNYYTENEGKSMSWTEPENFWYYCSNNAHKGLSIVTDVGGGQLEKGDIIQLMTGEEISAQVIITEVVTDTSGHKVDFLVCGHDGELSGFPLSMLHYDSLRLIKILGFSEE